MKRHFFAYTLMLACLALGLADCANDNKVPKGASGAGGITQDAAAGSGGAGTGGSTGTGGSMDATSETSTDATADSDGGCPYSTPKCCQAKYELGADADTSGLCEPAEALGCNCLEFHAGSVECSPDGSVCCHSSDGCSPKPQCGWVHCGQGGQRLPSCPASQAVFDKASQQDFCDPCTKDSHCLGGKTCSWRLGDRMFCEL